MLSMALAVMTSSSGARVETPSRAIPETIRYLVATETTSSIRARAMISLMARAASTRAQEAQGPTPSVVKSQLIAPQPAVPQTPVQARHPTARSAALNMRSLTASHIRKARLFRCLAKAGSARMAIVRIVQRFRVVHPVQLVARGVPCGQTSEFATNGPHSRATEAPRVETSSALCYE